MVGHLMAKSFRHPTRQRQAPSFDLPSACLYFSPMTALQERRLKSLLKDAVSEVLNEQRVLVREAVREALEENALLRATRAGETSKRVSRTSVMRQLSRAS
jgi:hypothetical protein